MLNAIKNFFGNNKPKAVVKVRPQLEGLESRETPAFVSATGALSFGNLVDMTPPSAGVRLPGNQNGVLRYEREQPVLPYNQFLSSEQNYFNRVQVLQAHTHVVDAVHSNPVSATPTRFELIARARGWK